MPNENITSYTMGELLRDRQDSLLDIATCQRALANGILTYGYGNHSVRERLDRNTEIVRIIDAELARRGATLQGEHHAPYQPSTR